MSTIHFMRYGMTACLQNGPPKDWPAGHRWSSDWTDVTCKACLAGKEETPTFTISPDGKSITCLRCKRTSHNPNDVEQHYCGHCTVFHDDIWPPARAAWLKAPLGGRLPPAKCPSCGYVMDAAAGVTTSGEAPRLPGPGDVTICMCCASVLFYTESMELRKATEEERAEMDASPEFKKLIDGVLAAVKSVRPLMEQKYGPLPRSE